MSLNRSVFIAFVPLLLAGCAAQDIREGVFGGLYDGVRIQDMSHNTPSERANMPEMGYEQYSLERKKLIDDDTRK
jgi:hypothetical protein